MENNKKQIVWWPSDKQSFNCKAACESLDAALKQAQKGYDKHIGPYYGLTYYRYSPIINIGELKPVPILKFCQEFAKSIPDRIESDMYDNFTSGMDCETEVCWSKEDSEAFCTKVANKLSELISRFVHYVPSYKVERYPRRYDLENKEWTANGMTASRIEAEEISNEDLEKLKPLIKKIKK